MREQGIAIIGIGCRFPGNVNDAEALWKMLAEGREAVSEVPADRWNVARFYDSEAGIVGKSVAKRGGFIEGLDQFDPQFFGISPREAPYVDPQHRLLLETAWEAMEDAGIVLDLEKGTGIAVFVGVSHNDYQIIQGTPWDSSGISPHSPTGSAHSIAANRISYCFNLRGPSIAMDTACSSALTAVHVACDHIRAGRCTTALAGGVTIMVTPGGFIGFSQAGMLSPDGHCKAFDASANGFVRGEGAGMVVLKDLQQAIADGDPIHAVILGTSVNQDGHTNGISLPSPEAQARLVADACIDAGIDPSEVGFVEAHGTGTAVGDPIEAHALAEALCGSRKDVLAMGSVKTNLGHLETAAGIVGLVKAALVVKHGQIPPSLHFNTPSPHIDFEALKLRIPTELEPFPDRYARRIAGVNSFGFGGANAHVIVAEPPSNAVVKHAGPPVERAWPVMLSARSEEALKTSAKRLASWLDEHSRSNGKSPILPDLTYTLGARRNHHAYRLTLAAKTNAEVVQELEGFASGEQGKVRSSFTPRPEHAPRIGFVMSGQGPQWWGMGRQLMAREPVFREVMERCDAAMRPWARFSLLEELNRDEASSKVSRTEIGQPAIFAMQVALAALWKSWDVTPSAIVGHSVGEIAASCVAGILSLEEAARVIVLRARLMENCARGEGTMLAVGIDEEQAAALISRHDRTVSIAAFNGPRSLTLSGARTSLEAIAAELEPQGIFAKFVRVDHPFHHAMMQPAADELTRELASLKPQPEVVPFFSTVTGDRCKGEDCVAAHWGRGIRQAVQFVPAVNAMAECGVDVWLELSSHPALVVSIQECLGALGMKAPVMGSARREREHECVLESALDLHRAGVTVNFAAMTPSRNQLSLPTYAWEKSRWWSESADWREGRLGHGGRGLLDVRLPRAVPTWIARLDNRHLSYLKDHKVENLVVFPAAGFVDLVLEAGVQHFEGRPFVIEDFEIRKPLILPEQASTVLLEISYDPAERTFTIQSRFEHAATWSVHVVGSMRGERTDTPFNSSTWNGRPAPGLAAVSLDDFYGRMSDVGLRYGPEFKPVRDLWAGAGRSAGHVSLSEATAVRAPEYPLHPVLLDGALHVFSAGAHTVEERGARIKLPVRFGRICFLRSPGVAARVRAEVVHCSEEYLEGDLSLYDEAGLPCVMIEGFRAIGMSSARKAGAPGGSRDLVYHIEWERTQPNGRPAQLRPLPLEKVLDAAAVALEEVVAVRGRAALEATMAAEDELAAAHIAQGLASMGVAAESGSFTASSLRVSAPMLKAFGRLTSALVKRGALKQDGEGWKALPAFDNLSASATDELRTFLERHPGHLPEGLLCASMGAELGPILRGEKDAVQVLFTGANADLLDQFYGDGLFSSHWMAAIASGVQTIANSLPGGRGLNILEVGAGTGGLASHVLPLLERGLHHYTFTDVSAGFFPAALGKLAAFPEVECKVFDLEKPGTQQGFDAGAFDVIIGTNVLHAVADVRATLACLFELLKPGGTLLFMDVSTPQLWTESVFGLTSGWWHLKDRDLRPEQPLMPREKWETVLRETGFTEVSSMPGLHHPQGEGQMALLARKAWVEETDSKPAVEHEALESSWVVFADKAGLGDGIVDRLTSRGARCRVVRRGGQFSRKQDSYDLRAEVPEDWKTLLDDCSADAPPERLVYLWPLDEPVEDSALMGTDALLHLTQAIEQTTPAARLRMDLVTRNAQPVDGQKQPVAVAQAASIGLFRVVLSEHPNFACRGIDLPAETSSSDSSLLWQELLRKDVEREVAFRGEARYAQRLTRGLPSVEQPLSRDIPMRLESRERGLLNSLRLAPFAPPPCGHGEVMIEVKAAGMNFRDVLKALALYPAETPDARIFGDEVGGIVSAVGEGVTHVKPGDRVFGLSVFGLATHSLARGADVRRLPEHMSFEEAATIPVVFMTAWHALKNVARMRAGEWILVHAGAGGVGMAAIQIAQHMGVEVIASAGNPSKRALLETLGVKHVIDSRRGDFASVVMEITGRRGVDAVLNSLAAEAIPMGLSCLAEFGRFIEIGKRDIYQNSRIPLWPLRKNASFHVVAMDAVFSGDEKLTRDLLAEIAGLMEKGALRPLPYRSFPACRIDAAFRLMAQGKHIGKVVVAFPDVLVPRRGEVPSKPFSVKPDGVYLITGAFGGFGKVIARWLVDCGARHLALSSRSGASTPEAADFLAELQAEGVEVRVIKADAGSADDVTRLVQEATAGGLPLSGVFHLAMVIDDVPMSALNRERMRMVLAPKALGARLLHEATKDLALDCFVMFSSVSSIFGNPAQGNYSAANAFLDALAHHRHAQGLPALTINWGVLGGEGYVARNERVAEFLARQGTAALSPGEVISLMESFLAASSTQVAAIRVDWSKWRQSFRGLQENPLLERVFASGMENQESGGGNGSDWKLRIEAAVGDERQGLINEAVREVVGSVLRVKPGTLRDDQPLTDLGLDSLMGVEIENSLEGTIGVALPPTSLMRARTIGQIGTLIGEHMGSSRAAAVAPVPGSAKAAEVVTAPVSEVDLDALSDADIDELLGEASTEDDDVDSNETVAAGA